MVRMKDSEDYITRRAANPRTGIVSPSLGTPEPRPQHTPDTPKEALKLSKEHARSPALVLLAARPLLSRADEGRKVSVGSSKWCAQRKGWYLGEETAVAASPKQTAATAVTTKLMRDDELPHMPSAKEPQPFAYPGRMREQIQPFEHDEKTRRVSNEGYDSTAAGAPRNAPTEATHSTTDAAQSSHPLASAYHHHHHHHHHHAAAVVAQSPNPRIKIAKRLAPSHSNTVTRQELNFAPFSSPRTPSRDGAGAAPATALRTFAPVPASESRNTFQRREQGQGQGFESIGRSPRRSAPMPSVAHTADHDEIKTAAPKVMKARRYFPSASSLDASDYDEDPVRRATYTTPLTLNEILPKVQLVRPELAALAQRHPRARPPPQYHHGREIESTGRRCSLGCRKQESSSECLEEKKHYIYPESRLSFEGEVDDEEEEKEKDREREKENEEALDPKAYQPCLIAKGLSESILEIACSLSISAWRAAKQIQLPRFELVDALSNANTTHRQKVEVLKAGFSLMGQAFAMLTLIAVCWQLGSACFRVLQVLMWPLVVPWRILRWVLTAGAGS